MENRGVVVVMSHFRLLCHVVVVVLVVVGGSVRLVSSFLSCGLQGAHWRRRNELLLIARRTSKCVMCLCVTNKIAATRKKMKNFLSF